MSALRKNGASQNLTFALVNASTGAALTGATVTAKRSIDGAAQASVTGTVTELAGGQYNFAPSQADTNGTTVSFLFTATSAIPVNICCFTANYDTTQPVVTSGTGTDQLSLASGKVLLQATQIGVTIPTVTTVTNQLTAAAIATGVWQDATAGDFTAASSIGKSLYTSGVVPGASGGLLISGSNSGTTTLGALTVTGALTASGGIAVSAGMTIIGSANGAGLTISGGGTSGAGLLVNTTSGDAVQLTPTAGHGLNIAANGTSKHGITSTGGTAGTSDGIKAVAGTGGVDIRGNITGNLVGAVSTLTTYTGNTVQTGDAFARLGAPAGASVSADVAALKADTAAVKTQTDKLAFSVTNQVDANVLTVAGAASNIKKGQALANFEFLMTDSTNHNPATGLTVTANRSIDGGAFGACTNAVTELSNGIYKISLSSSDLNGNVITFRMTAAASDDQIFTIVTQP